MSVRTLSAVAALVAAIASPALLPAQAAPPRAAPEVAAGPAVGTLPVPTLTPAEGAELLRLRRRVEALVAEAPWADAEPLLEELARATPYDGEVWYLLGRAREAGERLEAAAAAYALSLARGYRYGAATAYRVARLHGRAGNDSEALAWLARALGLGFGSRPSIGENSAFEGLADDPAFRVLAGPGPGEATGRDAGLRADLDYLLAEARRLHVGPGSPARSEEFAGAVADLQARIPRISDRDFVLAVGRLLVRLGDGHSGLLGPQPDTPLDLGGDALPLSFYRFSDGLFVRDGAGAAAEWIGAEVLAFGDVPAAAAVDSLAHYMHADNAMTPLWLGVHHTLPSLPFLAAIGATDRPDAATLTLRAPDGRASEVTFEGGAYGLAFDRKLQGSPAGPLYLQRVEEPYWTRPLPERDALYFQFNQVRNAATGPDLAAFADSLRRELVRTGATHLIVDVRHNNGGNNGLLRPLVRTLVWWEMERPEHRIWVVMGRGTFSAAQNFIARVERWTDATFVGEPSSSSPNFTGETTDVTLPYSRLHVSISNRWWQESEPDDLRPFIAPDLPVGLSSDAYFAGRDPALEAIFLVTGR